MGGRDWRGLRTRAHAAHGDNSLACRRGPATHCGYAWRLGTANDRISRRLVNYLIARPSARCRQQACHRQSLRLCTVMDAPECKVRSVFESALSVALNSISE